MKVKSVDYSKLVSDGDYGNTKIGISVELDEGDNPKEALEKCKRFVEVSLGTRFIIPPTDEELSYAKGIIQRKEGFDNDDDIIW